MGTKKLILQKFHKTVKNFEIFFLIYCKKFILKIE